MSKVIEVSKYTQEIVERLNKRVALEVEKQKIKEDSETAIKFEKKRNDLIACADYMNEIGVKADFVSRIAINHYTRLIEVVKLMMNNNKISSKQSNRFVCAILANSNTLRDSVEYDFNLLYAMCSKEAKHGLERKLVVRELSGVSTATSQANIAKSVLSELGVLIDSQRTENMQTKGVSKSKVVFNFESENYKKLISLL